ncbi:glycosyltransferase family 4 protein [Mumia zhuanghuii]|uniref:Glycosyltransferase family 4 protein n=2 Tax=Mumia TaxID=1546255 RepID=A0ABW1QF61_9ACTN|nr:MULTISPECIES: glycosyltransferase family 4 protein [Mumia]KAA1422778.1 glycosyltransferase family 4 protein [Mumia zhuanghuii]
MPPSRTPRGTVLVATPSADVYGSDLQLRETVRALVAAGWRVRVATGSDGPLVAMMQAEGAEAAALGFPALRRAYASPVGLLRLVRDVAAAAPRAWRLVRRTRPDVVLVNTLTLPWWTALARTCRVPVVCHVHEAEQSDPRPLRIALARPLSLATTVVANSSATIAELADVNPRLGGRVRLVHNGVRGPGPIQAPPPEGPRRLVVVGRLSVRKAPHVALDVLERLLAQGRDVELALCGSALPDQAAYEAELHARASTSPLAGRVQFAGHVAPVWPELGRAHVLLAPSRGESLGNAVIEAQLAGRAVVATAVQGHLESVVDGESGLLAPVDDADAMASQVARILDDPELYAALVAGGRARAEEMFSPQRYAEEMQDVIASAADR